MKYLLKMPKSDSQKNCPLLDEKITRVTCYEIGEVLEDSMDIETCIVSFDFEMAKNVCPACSWNKTPIE